MCRRPARDGPDHLPVTRERAGPGANPRRRERPRPLVAWLRDTGHDVLYAAESRKQTPDADLLAEAEAQGYIVLTGDKDCGELIFRDHSISHGVILLRMKNRPAAIRLVRLQQVWILVESRLPGHFVVVTASKIRLRPLTTP
ncbi:MAG: DUF5615 family PIN-like protein [Isosphaeraceae bacterium]